MLLFDEMIAPTEGVTISNDEYADLLAVAEKWEMFRIFFYDNAVKTKNGELAIEGYKICDAMSVIDRQKYKEVLNG